MMAFSSLVRASLNLRMATGDALSNGYNPELIVQNFLAAPDAFDFVLGNFRLTTGLLVIAGDSVFSRGPLCN